uniref:Myosin VC n=1 Tax=Oncorhynchus kisutch TaxID=8019 RepID=A0A8C7HH66_ONCKI
MNSFTIDVWYGTHCNDDVTSTLGELLLLYNRVWIPDAEHVWKSAEILRDFKPGDEALELQLDDGTMVYPLDKSSPQLPHLRNPDILVGENDLTALSYLHEPAVLHNLKVRFVESNIIYSYCGIILVAVNPYKQLHIYGDAVLQAYSGQNMGAMDPHIFAVAEEAYKQMARNNKNQSVIVSGESGAGKTVSARYVMRYFAMVSKSSSKTHVEDKVLASNPITEAIGNAKTTRNDNSSRFGKYTEISFDRRYQIIGANMRTYLMEKSRVVSQSENERNYHIFYQMCACAEQSEFKSLRLLSADEFRYTCMGGETGIEGVDDRKDMEETRRTFSLLGKSHHFSDVFKVLAGILHLGNVEIRNVGSDRSSVSSSDQHLAAFCDLLGVSPDGVTRWLCHRRIAMVAETVVKAVPSERAVNSRDALAKQIYAHLFDCVIQKINAALQVPGKQHSFIGVLDIYGFETFEINSFEQFCINYANEKLQQQFNLHVFKLEQDEYMKEDIPWTLIDFYDNQPVIDLIEAKMGILDLLDEECLFPQGTDQNWLQKLYNYLVDNPLFEKPRMSNKAFIIQHFADKVQSQSQAPLSFTVVPSQAPLSFTFPLLANFFLEVEPDGLGTKGIKVRPARPRVKPANKNHRTTVGEKQPRTWILVMHSAILITLSGSLCLVRYDSKRVVQQLRACGVLETIHISAQSYPSRWTYIEFYSRYSVLMSQEELGLNHKKLACKTVLQRLIQDSDQNKFGRTKIFFRAGQVAYLEKLRLDRLRKACLTIQKHVRGWSHRRKFLRMREAAIVLQQYVRGHKTVTAAVLKQGWASVVIQRYWRSYLTRQIYRMVHSSSIIIQAFTRGWIARKRYKKMVEVQKALILQKYARAWLARRRFQSLRRLVHNVQLSYRCQKLGKKLEDQVKMLLEEHAEEVERENKEVEREKQEVEREKEEVEREKEEVEREKEEVEREKEEVEREKQEVEREKEEVEREKEEVEREKEEVEREKQEVEREQEEVKREKEEMEREKEEVEREKEVVKTEKEEVEREKEEVEREKEEVEREKVEVKTEKEEVEREKEEVGREKEKVEREKEEVGREKEKVEREEVEREKEEVKTEKEEEREKEEVKREKEEVKREKVKTEKEEVEREKEEVKTEKEEVKTEEVEREKEEVKTEKEEVKTEKEEVEREKEEVGREKEKVEREKEEVEREKEEVEREKEEVERERRKWRERRRRGVNMIPNMAAQLLFMCVRHADYLNDGAKLKSLMNAIICGVKKVITDHREDFELLSFWLSNTYHILSCLKQYSGEEEFMKQNSPRQKKNCLQNFDLSEHRQIFSDLAIRIYHQFISVMEKTLIPMIVPCMLEHESLQDVSSMKPTGFRKRSSSIYEDQEVCTIYSLIQQLSLYHSTMSQHGMEEGLAVKQTFFLVGADTLNNILLRKDMCSCRKGMQIRCNISHLEAWLKEKDLVQGTMATLKPLCQAAWLLQVNKTTDDDIKDITEQCSELSPVQIVKILNSYTPNDDFEKRVAPSFVRKIQVNLDPMTRIRIIYFPCPQGLLQDLTFPFTPSSQALELLEIPSSLRLGFLTRI